MANTITHRFRRLGLCLRGEAETAALLGPGARQHSDPLERARRQVDRLPALDDCLDDGRFEERQREAAADVSGISVNLPCEATDGGRPAVREIRDPALGIGEDSDELRIRLVRWLTASLHDQLRLDPAPLQVNGNREAEGVLEAPDGLGI